MLVHYYSIGYMKGDEGYYRFFAYLNLFMFSMFILILADNYLLMFLAWEAVGLCSYLLISFWFRKKSASQAGKKAFLVNRVGDFGFTLGIFLIFTTFGTLQFTGVFSQEAVKGVSSGTLTAICLLLFMGAMGKSAQFPLHVWLPDAMEGPTPVSALIHAATMVNAGVYMVARSYPLFMHSEAAMYVVMIIGTITAIYAALIALTQTDIKRVIAYSTLSSLGFMFMALGAGAWVAGIFYLLVHGFFKGLLFLDSGSVIHAMSGEQDMRLMGGLRKKLPITFWTMLIGAMAMAGIPLLSGFWAKDEIIAAAFVEHYYVVWIVGVITALVTAIYMGRLIFLTFWGENRASDEVKAHIHESSATMTVPLIILAIPAAFMGLLVGWPPDAGQIHHYLEPVFFEIEEHAFEWAGVGGLLMLLSTVGRAGRRLRGLSHVRQADRAAGARRRALPVGVPVVVQQVLHGRVLRAGRHQADDRLRRLALDVLRRQGHRRRRQRPRRAVGPPRLGPAPAPDGAGAELRVRRLRRLLRPRRHRLDLGCLMGWNEQIGFPVLSVLTFLPALRSGDPAAVRQGAAALLQDRLACGHAGRRSASRSGCCSSSRRTAAGCSSPSRSPGSTASTSATAWASTASPPCCSSSRRCSARSSSSPAGTTSRIASAASSPPCSCSRPA